MKKVSILFIYLSIAGIKAHAGEDHEKAADILRLVMPATAYGMTFIFEDQKGRKYFYQSFFTTVGVTYGLKKFVDKKRPNGDLESFPSGHTSLAFSGASFIQRRYGWKYGTPSYIVASLVGLSSIKSDNHYPEDVLAGAAIGVACTYLFTKPYKKNIHLVSITERGVYGVALRIDW